MSVAEGSAATKHGGIVSGMMLIEINRQRTAGMSQDRTMQVMQAIASQPRVLTLARRVPSPRTAPRDPPSEEGGPETSTPSSADRAVTSDSRSTTSDAASEARNMQSTSNRSSSRESPASSRAHSASSSSCDVDTSSFSAGVSVPLASAGVSGPNNPATTQARHRITHQRTLALRFVGSRGDVSLFDRDHILGLKERDIEFVTGGSSSEAHRAHKANSHRSLGELTRDWRNDPFSTPARRRRLINDACKVIVTSYTQASALRVMGLRKQEAAVARIQAAARMWSARRRYVAKLGERRGMASFAIQLVWLSFKARQRMSILREERDHARRVDETKRKRQLAAEEDEKRRREEVIRREEADALEQKRHLREQELAVLVQRRVREMQVRGYSRSRLLWSFLSPAAYLAAASERVSTTSHQKTLKRNPGPSVIRVRRTKNTERWGTVKIISGIYGSHRKKCHTPAKTKREKKLRVSNPDSKLSIKEYVRCGHLSMSAL